MTSCDYCTLMTFRCRWTSPSFIVPKHGASTSCVTLTPDVSSSYTQDDPLPEPRTMVNLIILPTGKILAVNGARMGIQFYWLSTVLLIEKLQEQLDMATRAGPLDSPMQMTLF